MSEAVESPLIMPGLSWETPTLGCVVGGGLPRIQLSGAQKDLLVELHDLRGAECAQKDFTLWWRWSYPGTAMMPVWQEVGCSLIANNASTNRLDWRMKDPFSGKSATLHYVAARIKEGRLTDQSMLGREGDHQQGRGGWDTLM